MKYTSQLIICIIIVCYGNYNAQNYVEINASHYEIAANEIKPHNNPMPNWQNDWTKESVIAIYKIIKLYGYPDEMSPNRMHWRLPGEINRTITYTENFWLVLPHDSIPEKKGNRNFTHKKSQR